MNHLCHILLIRYIVLVLLIFPILGVGQSSKIDSLEQIVQTASNPNDKVDALVALAYKVVRTDLDQTMVYANRGIQLAKENNYQKGLGNAYMIKGLVLRSQNQFDSAVEAMKNSWDIAQNLADSTMMTKALANLGQLYRIMGEYDQSIDYSLKASRLNEHLKNKRIDAFLFAEIGNVYVKMKAWNKALKYQQKALKIHKEAENQYGISTVSNTMGVIYQEQNLLDSAYFYFNISLDIKKQKSDQYGWMVTKDNICALLMDKKEQMAALTCFKELIPIEEKLDSKKDLIRSLINLGTVYQQLKSYEKGITTIQRGLEIAESTQNLPLTRNAHQALSAAFEESGHFKKALSHEKMARIIADSILNETKTSQISKLEIAYETEKKERKIQVQQLELANQQQQLRLQRTLTGGIVTGLILTFAALLWYFQQKQKQRRQLAQVKHQEQLLQATVESVEAERKRISKDLHDGIGQQLTGLKMALQQLSDKWKKQAPEASNSLKVITKNLTQVSNEVRSISHQMMPATLRELGLKAALQDMLQKSFNQSNINYEFETHNANKRFPENIEIGLYRIAQELVNNILKHSNAKHVNIELFTTKSHLILIIEDDGNGFNPKSTKEIGNGINNINSRAKSVNGNVSFEKRQESGVAATIRVPL